MKRRRIPVELDAPSSHDDGAEEKAPKPASKKKKKTAVASSHPLPMEGERGVDPSPLEANELCLVYVIEREDRGKATPHDVDFRILGLYRTLGRAREEHRNAQEFYTLKHLSERGLGGTTEEERRAFVEQDFLKAWDMARKCDTWMFGSRFEIRTRRVRLDGDSISPESGLVQ